MYVACSTLCFRALSLDEALRTIRELRFPKADLAIHDAGPHLTPADVCADIGKVAQRLKTANLPIAAFHVDIRLAEPEVARMQLRAICRLARVSTVPLITVPAAARGSDLDREVARLQEWVRCAASDGLMLTVETHADTVTADPLGAIELCKRVPGLGITLDPSHYHATPHDPMNYDPLIPYVRHVRLRDTGKTLAEFQVRIGQGELEFGRVVTQLDRCRYDRALTVDIRDVAESPFPVEPEVRKLKYVLESLV